MDTLDVAQYTVQNGGGTFSHSLGSVRIPPVPENPIHAWVVAVTPTNGSNTVTDVGRITRTGFDAETIIAGAVWDFIRLHHESGHMFGTWFNDGKLYIDHVIFTTKETAERIARERGELAIFNLSTKETVSL